jgi:hypothetical protein
MIIIDHNISSIDIGEIKSILFEERYSDDDIEMGE